MNMCAYELIPDQKIRDKVLTEDYYSINYTWLNGCQCILVCSIEKFLAYLRLHGF